MQTNHSNIKLSVGRISFDLIVFMISGILAEKNEDKMAEVMIFAGLFGVMKVLHSKKLRRMFFQLF